MKYLSPLIIPMAVVFLVTGCKKDAPISSSSQSLIQQNTSGLINEEGYFCTPVNGEELEVKRLYGEYRLYEAINSPNAADRTNKLFYFMPDDPDPSTPNEFVITGYDPFTGSLEMKLDNFVNCRFEPAPEYPNTKIIFDPADPAGDNKNIRMWVISNSTNLHFRNLNIYVRWNGSTPTNGLDFAIDYNIALISITENNSNILMNDNHIQGSEMSLMPGDPVQDMIYEGGIRVGTDIDNGTHAYNVNNNICFVQNTIEDFRIYGISANDAQNVSILHNNISKIWERDNSFISQAGGIHLTYVRYCDIAYNNIRSIYSLNDDGPCNEQFQHGVYVSKYNQDIHLEHNELRWISGAGFHISPGLVGTPLQNIYVKENLIYYAANSGILLRESDNVEILNNNIYHCGYRISSSSGLPAACGSREEVNGALDLREYPGAITNIKLYGNRIKNNHPELYDDATSRAFHLVCIVGNPSLLAEIKDPARVNSNHICLENYNVSTHGHQHYNPSLFHLDSEQNTCCFVRSYVNLTVDGHCVIGSGPGCTNYNYPSFGSLSLTPNCL